MRIHAALCVVCGLPIKRAGESVAPAAYPFGLAGFHETDQAHRRCANDVFGARFAVDHATALARAEFGTEKTG